MQLLNYEVEVRGRNVHAVARDFLESQGLIPPGAASGDRTAGSVIIGSKNFTEQEILGEIMAILIEYQTDIQVVRQLNLGGALTCFYALRAGAIDRQCQRQGSNTEAQEPAIVTWYRVSHY